MGAPGLEGPVPEQKSRVPRVVVGVDPRALPLSPLEGFVLSRVDGAASVSDIADLTCLDLGMVLATVEKLVALDAVEWADGATGLPRPSFRPGAPSSSPVPRRPPAEAAHVFPAPPGRVGRADLGTALMAPPVPELASPPLASPALVPSAPLDAPALDAVTTKHDVLASLDAASSEPATAKYDVLPSLDAEAPRGGSARSEAPKPPVHAPRERGVGMHVYSARHESEPPMVETVDRHEGRSHSHVPSRTPGASPASVRPPTLTRASARPTSAEPSSTPASSASMSGAAHGPGNRSEPTAAPHREPLGVGVPPKAVSDEVDLPEERRRKIDELYVVVDLLDHYQVLGLKRDADRAKVKTAYFDLSKQFHPDTAFRKNVGPYLQKMEVIFKRLTEAYDVLSKKKAREEYDAYLARSEQSQEYEQTLSSQHELEGAMAAIEAEEARKRAEGAKQAEAARLAAAAKEEEARRAAANRRDEAARREAGPAPARPATPPDRLGAPNSPAVFSPRSGSSPGVRPSQQGIPAAGRAPTSPGVIPSPRGPSFVGEAPSPRGPALQGVPSARGATSPGAPAGPTGSADSGLGGERPLMSDEAKRRAKELLTRRLDAGRSQPSAPTPRAPTPDPTAHAATKDEVIRDLATSLMGVAQVTGGLDPVQRHVAEARRALADGQLPDAVRKLKLAVALSPDDVEIRALHDRTARELAASLADNYAEQAAYEERQKKWAAAAISWQKVVDGRPDEAGCHWRGAKALLESSGDLKQAVRLAQRAVELDANNVFAVRTLGRAYMAAGMTLNAKRELERAVMLDPRDEPTQALLKELKSG